MHPKKAGLIAAIWASMAVAPVSAQSGNLSSDTKTATIRFDNGSGTRGYIDAYMKMSYKLIVCDGDVHVSYSLIPDSVESDGRYYLNGKEWKTTAPLPTVSSISFDSSIGDGVRTIGSVGDKFAAKSLGMSCFSGQTKKVAPLRDLISVPASNENITYFLNSMALRSNTDTRVFTSTVLTSALAEQEINTLASPHTGNSNGSRGSNPSPDSSPRKESAKASSSPSPQTSSLPQSRSKIPSLEDDSLENHSQDIGQNDTSEYMSCFIRDKAFSPIYRLSGSRQSLDTWVNQQIPNIPVKGASAMWAVVTYSIYAKSVGIEGITYQTVSYCTFSLGLESARKIARGMRFYTKNGGVPLDWVLEDSSPNPPVKFIKVE